MPEVYLGEEGGELKLPPVKWLSGSKPDLPVSLKKQIITKQMSDGTIRYAILRRKRSWILSWGYLTKSQLDAIEEKHNLNVTLRLQNNWESDEWYEVTCLTFDYAPIDTALRSMERYRLTMRVVEL